MQIHEHPDYLPGPDPELWVNEFGYGPDEMDAAVKDFCALCMVGYSRAVHAILGIAADWVQYDRVSWMIYRDTATRLEKGEPIWKTCSHEHTRITEDGYIEFCLRCGQHVRSLQVLYDNEHPEYLPGCDPELWVDSVGISADFLFSRDYWWDRRDLSELAEVFRDYAVRAFTLVPWEAEPLPMWTIDAWEKERYG